jgi:hypothetical protein
VKHWKVDGGAHGYTPPDQWLDIDEFNTQNGNVILSGVQRSGM